MTIASTMNTILSSGIFLLGLGGQFMTPCASNVEVVVSDDAELFAGSSFEHALHQLPDNVDGRIEIQNNTVTSSSSESTTRTNHSSCRVFIAPSTIPGAGMGVFAGTGFEKGDEVTTGDGVVPLIDMPWHNDVSEFVDDFLWGTLNCLSCQELRC
jgi:hypothetical protein